MLRRCLLRRCAFTSSGASTPSPRFVSPFAETGFDPSSAAAFQSSNPIQRLRREEARSREVEESIDLHLALDQQQTRDKEILAASQARQRARSRSGDSSPSAYAPPHEHSDLVARISDGSFRHLEEYRQQVAAAAGQQQQQQQQQHVSADLDNFLPLPDFATLPADYHMKWPYGGKVGFALDIDGVLMRGTSNFGIQRIEGVKEALQFLRRAKIPFVLVTNSGGDTELETSRRNFKLLGIDTDPHSGNSMFTPKAEEKETEQMMTMMKDDIISETANKQEDDEESKKNRDLLATMSMLSHTPMRLLALENPDLTEKPVLVLGPPTAVDVLRSYGFKKPMHVQELQSQHPELVPLKMWPPGSPQAERAQAAIKKARDEKRSPAKEHYPSFAAVFVMSARGIDVFNDFQVTLDVVLGENGQPGGAHVAAKQTVPVYWCAEDMFWAGPMPLPRLAVGAVKEMFTSLFESVAGEPLDITSYGKPRRITYVYAQELLRQQNALLGWGNQAPDVICMVGDNLETDIAGANAMNVVGACGAASQSPSWLSVQVMTGVGRPPLSAYRTVADSDEELKWLLTHFADPIPHYVAPTFRHFVGELVHFPEEQMRKMQAFKRVLKNPVDLERLYRWKGKSA